VVQVLDRQPVDQAKMQEALPSFIEQFRETREREAVNEWFRKQSENTVLAGLPTIGSSR
jgi:hypothetical protein